MKQYRFFLVGMIILFTLFLAALGLTSTVTAAEKVPKFGGTLKVVSGGIKSLDPLYTSTALTRRVARHFYDFLFACDNKGVVQPMMVKEWNVSKDLKNYSFTLRQGLLFHDGQTVTSDDVIASLKRWGQKDKRGKHIFSVLEEIKKIDDRTFTMKLKEPYGLVPKALGWFGAYLPVIMPKELAANPPSKPVNEPIGSGPFRFVEWKPGKHLILERFKDYKPRQEPASGFAGKKIAYVDRIIFMEVPDQATQIAALETGELDIVLRPDYDQYDRIQNNPDLRTYLLKPLAWIAMVINKARPPFDNVKVRQALQAAINVDEITLLAVGHKRFFTVTPAIFFSGTVWDSKAGEELYNQADIEKAKALIADAGGPPKEPIILMAAKEYAYMYNSALGVKAILEKLGFKVDFMVTDYATIVSKRRNKDKWHMFSTSFTPYTTEPDNAIWMNPKWVGWYVSPRIEKLNKSFIITSDYSKQKQIVDEMQQVFYEEVPLLRLGEIAGFNAVRKEVQCFTDDTIDPIFWNVWLDN